MKLYEDLAEFYFYIEESHRDIEQDINFIRSLIKTGSTPSLLDLGCGTGEHLNILQKYGVHCIGLDTSHRMLDVALKRFPSKIDFFNMNMTDFDYYEEFDIVICLFGSFNYILDDQDVEKTLWNTWRALKPEGKAIFEIWNSIPIQKIKEKPLTRVSVTSHNETTIERFRGFKLMPEENRTLVDVHYKYSLSNHNDTGEIEDKHIMRAYKLEEISKFVKDNGFKIENKYASFTKELYNEHSNKIILQLVKE